MKIDELIKATERVNIGKSGFAFISSNDKKYVAHPTIEAGTEGKGDWVGQMYGSEKGDFQYTFEGKENGFYDEQADRLENRRNDVHR